MYEGLYTTMTGESATDAMRMATRVRWIFVGSAILGLVMAGVWAGFGLFSTPAVSVSVSSLQSHDIPLIPGQSSSTVDAFRSKIQHVVYIIKENRSFDNYFGTFPGADGATSGLISTGERMLLGHTPDRTPRDLGHGWPDAHTAID